MAAGLRLALTLGATGCAPSAWVVVSDLHGDGWFVVDATTGEVGVDHDLAADFPEACRDDADRYCLVYQSRARATAAGDAEVVVTFSPASLAEGADAHDPANNGQIVGYPLTAGAAPRWRVDRLDWSMVDPDQRICRRDPADPCAPAPDTTAEEAQSCALFWPHDVHVLGDDGASLKLLVADTRNQRVIWLETATADTCATVTEVLNAANPDWDIYTSVNAVDPWEDADGRHLLMSIKDTRGDPAQQAGDGRGKIVAFLDDGGGWRQEWEFPPWSATEPSFVNAPHGVSHDTNNVYFAHSLGRSEEVNEGAGGSVGVLDRAGNYRYDGVVATRWLGFTRDVTPLPDGRVVVVDSGEKGSTTAPARTHLYVVGLPELPPTPSVDGVWTEDHRRQLFVPLDLLHHPDTSDRWVLYSAEPAPEPSR